MIPRRAVLAQPLLAVSAAQAATLGRPAPALRLTLLDGSEFDLAAQRGRVVLVNAWATWCVPCREEMPALAAFLRANAARGLVLLGLSADKPRDLDAVRRIMAGFGYPAGLLRGAAENGFGAPGVLPTTWLVDRAGLLRAEWRPDSVPITTANLERLVGPVLAER